MIDFRRLLCEFAAVAFLASIAVPAYASDFGCTGTSDNRPTRAESNDDLAGNIVLTCSGGIPTIRSLVIPLTTITVTANTNITSRILAITGGVIGTAHFNEALLMIDEPNSNTTGCSPTSALCDNRTMSNCGFNGEDSSLLAGPGVCQIIAPADPATTYDGSYSDCAPGTFGCGRPNVFQGRQAESLVGGVFNKIQFVGVPLDAPGTTTNRIIRIANIRIDSTAFGLVSPFATVPVTATVSLRGYLNLDVTVQMATVELGMQSVVYPFTGFLQCVGTDQVLGNSPSSPFYSGTGPPIPVGPPTGGMDIRVIENFSTAWKVRNVRLLTNAPGGNGTLSFGSFTYAGTTNWTASDLVQNVPGVNYNTEAGFENGAPGNATPSPNPPAGFGTPVLPLANPFVETVGPTNIQNAGVASQGTRISIEVGNLPAGARLFFPINVLLQNQADASVTGVMQVDADADQNGFTSFTSGSAAPFLAASPTAFLFTGSNSGPTGPVTNTTWVEVTSASPVITYEMLFTRADALEYADIVPALVYNNNGLPSLPQTGVLTTATVSFAPIQSGLANPSRPQMDGAYSTPRFTSSFKSPADTLFTIDSCISGLIEQVMGLGLSKGETTSLTAKLQAALGYLAGGDTADAIAALQAFINEVNALVKSGRLTGAVAAPLISAAKSIIATL